jgi:ABC-type Zn2+ transport system substrate-binding protein/surface adhesin
MAMAKRMPTTVHEAYAQHAAEVIKARAAFEVALRAAERRLRRAVKAVETK